MASDAMNNNEKWLQWAVELQSLTQAGLFYSNDVFDTERYDDKNRPIKYSAFVC